MINRKVDARVRCQQDEESLECALTTGRRCILARPEPPAHPATSDRHMLSHRQAIFTSNTQVRGVPLSLDGSVRGLLDIEAQYDNGMDLDQHG